MRGYHDHSCRVGASRRDLARITLVVPVSLLITSCTDPLEWDGTTPICALAPELKLELPCSTAPIRIADDPGFVTLAAGSEHTCGLTAAGGAYCWGRDLVGELGMGGWPAVGTSPVALAGSHRFVDIAAGQGHTCAIEATGEARCWGSNDSGQLGTGEGPGGTPAPSPVPAVVLGSLAFSQIRGGAQHTCGVDTAGAAHCWGMDWYGEVGRGEWTMSMHAEPFPVVGGHTFASIDAGMRATCALTPGGQAWCWGFGDFGHLGTTQASICRDVFRDVFCSPEPVAVSTGHRFGALASGSNHACALTLDGEVFCWGDRGQGQLGPAPGTGHTPLALPGHRFARLYAGGSTNCGITAGGETLCWGGNWMGQLGTDTREYATETPAPIAGGHRFAVLSVGNAHACGITEAGATYCWGSNERGQLGVGRW